MCIRDRGHTALCYLGALAKLNTFDQVMADKTLRSHFDNFEKENVLPGLTLDLPFSKYDYCDLIAKRFSNSAIADDLGRICMDGWSKFPIFVRPTIKSCLRQKINPKWCYDSIASWYIYARRFARGQTHIPYVEPYWDQLEPLLKEGQEDNFSKLEALWSDLPRKYKDFAPEIVSAIAEARSHGDLKENAEYHAAREQQSFTEGRIQDIESKLANSEIVDISKIPPGDKVVFGALVSIINTENDELREYRIVGDDEADVSQGKISYKSPIARALIGKEIGDVAVVQAPSGEIEYEIDDVKYQ